MDASNQGGRPSTLGDFLKDARLAKGMELSDISARTRVRREYLSALEEGNYEALPEDIYARNFVRLFAQAVSVSGDKALELFSQERRRGAAPAPGASRRKARIFTSPAAAQPDGNLPEPLRSQLPREDDPGSAAQRSPDEDISGTDSPNQTAQDEGGSPPLRLEPTELQSAMSRPAQPPPGSVGIFPTQPVPAPRYARQQQQANNQRDFSREARSSQAGTRDGQRSSVLLSSAEGAARTRRSPNLGAWLPTLILIAAVVGLGLWAFNTLLFPNRSALPAETPVTQAETQPGAQPLTQPGGAVDAPVQSVGLSLETDPPGADVSVDGFLLAATTPFSNYAITPGGNRTLRVELPGYVPHEQVLDLSADTDLRVELTPEGQAQDAPEAASESTVLSAPPVAAGQVTVRIEDATWLEAYASTQRGVGERLVYTTVQPGQTFELPLPVYLHVGNAAGVHVWVGDQDRGLMGSSGEVVSRAYTQ